MSTGGRYIARPRADAESSAVSRGSAATSRLFETATATAWKWGNASATRRLRPTLASAVSTTPFRLPSTAPARAHLNLLGWISLFVMGMFYRQHADLDRRRLAIFQVAVWALASITLAAGIGLIYAVTPEAEPLAAISSIVLLADMLLFAWLVIRSRDTRPALDETPHEAVLHGAT